MIRWKGIWKSMLVLVAVFMVTQCKVTREVPKIPVPEKEGIPGMNAICAGTDTIGNILVSKAEALLIFQGDRFDVTLTLFAKEDSVIFLTAVSSGFEIIRASADRDSIRVIDRMNRVVYRMPLQKRFGYQHPVNHRDLENLVSELFLCDDMEKARETEEGRILFEFDQERIRKRIQLSRNGAQMEKFEFYHETTGEYLMGERTDNGSRIYSNFMVGEFEIRAGRGEKSYNRDLEVDMEVKEGRYTFIDLE